MSKGIDVPFVLFGAAHVATLLTVAFVSVALPMAVRRAGREAFERPVAGALAAALVAHELFKIGVRVYLHGEPLVQYLPLHLCSAAALLMAYVLVRRSYSAFEIGYFWGLGGTLQALLTPDLEQGFPSLPYLIFFLGHGLVIVSVLYATIVYRFRPTLRSVVKTIVVTLVFTALVAPLNIVFGTNYLYLRHKPAQTSLIDFFGPWPWYIPVLIGVGIVSCFIYYLPFLFLDWLSMRQKRP